MKTIGGYEIKNLEERRIPIKKHRRTFLYQGTIQGSDHKTIWDEKGRCMNLTREDCFIDVNVLPNVLPKELPKEIDYVELVKELRKKLVKHEKRKLKDKDDKWLKPYHDGWSNCSSHFIQMIDNWKNGSYNEKNF